MPDFVPCSPRHKTCSATHSDLVWSYRAERERQEIEWERLTGGYAGDAKHARATGHSVISFHEWLHARKVSRAA